MSGGGRCCSCFVLVLLAGRPARTRDEVSTMALSMPASLPVASPPARPISQFAWFPVSLADNMLGNGLFSTRLALQWLTDLPRKSTPVDFGLFLSVRFCLSSRQMPTCRRWLQLGAEICRSFGKRESESLRARVESTELGSKIREAVFEDADSIASICCTILAVSVKGRSKKQDRTAPQLPLHCSRTVVLLPWLFACWLGGGRSSTNPSRRFWSSGALELHPFESSSWTTHVVAPDPQRNAMSEMQMRMRLCRRPAGHDKLRALKQSSAARAKAPTELRCSNPHT
ncbi:hypothetical protein IWZ01DRAFT_527632 [Phyllosticta capitalensis]